MPGHPCCCKRCVSGGPDCIDHTAPTGQDFGVSGFGDWWQNNPGVPECICENLTIDEPFILQWCVGSQWHYHDSTPWCTHIGVFNPCWLSPPLTVEYYRHMQLSVACAASDRCSVRFDLRVYTYKHEDLCTAWPSYRNGDFYYCGEVVRWTWGADDFLAKKTIWQLPYLSYTLANSPWSGPCVHKTTPGPITVRLIP